MNSSDQLSYGMTRYYASLPQMNMPFKGAKVALLTATDVVVLLRDDRPDIPWPNYWDLPGGGREAEETPVACVLRETEEELSFALDPACIRWGRFFGEGAAMTWFFVGTLDKNDLKLMRLGDEGQTWQAMPIAEFVTHERAVPHFQTRLRAYLEQEEIGHEKPPASSSGGR